VEGIEVDVREHDDRHVLSVHGGGEQKQEREQAKEFQWSTSVCDGDKCIAG
jgi:hypothetical protein